ncbi:tRNA pseudouridine(13) synthase TruD, partial [Vibrio fluvialis]
WGRENVRSRNQNQRSLYLSAARSWIFNLIVSARLEQSLFDRVLLGDILFKGDEQLLVSAENHADLQSQYDAGDLVISGALAGDNALSTQDEALALEQVFLDAEPDLMALIRGNRMRHDRRAIALKPANLSWQVDGNSITLTFSL